jgi:DNA polymerase family A
MLEKTITYDSGSKNDWNLTLPIDANYSNQKRRVLIILQTVDSRDLKEEGLLAAKQTRVAFVEAVKMGRRMARQRKSNLGEFGLAVCNFNARRHLHLKDQARAEAESEFKVRVQKIIKKLNPTHILFSGEVNKLYPIKHAQLKHGWIHEFDGRKVVSTLDFSRLLEKVGLYANLLGFWCRDFANLLCEELPHSLADLKPKPFLVDTIKKFDHMMAEWDRVEAEGGETGLDTETKNLTVNKNRIFTMQMAFSHDPLVGYVLPIDHPHVDNPFTIEERKYIKRELKRRFGSYERKSLVICFNGAFDLRVIRKSLHLDIIYMPIWECMAGEHNLDENCSSLRYVGVKGDGAGKEAVSANGLAGVLCSYGNDFYLQDSGFTKADRATVASVSPKNKDFLRYAAMDVVSMIGIKRSQIDRAGLQTVEGKNYRPLFTRHMRYQMSDTVHQLSHLKEAGSLVNKKYLKSLMHPDSVLVKAIAELGEEFKAFPEVQAANKALLADAGFKTGGLFGSKGTGAWTFSFNKAVHKAKLFFDIMGMEAINKTEKGAPSVDKDFIETYKDRNFLVAKFGEYTAATKMLGTNVKGWLKLLRAIDGALDDHLRSDIVFFDVDTGRLASRNPNLQNIPTRGKLSKIIKEMFITPDGHLLIRFDYSAHEVRGWSWVSLDKILAATFKVGQGLRQKWIKFHPSYVMKYPLSPEMRKELENELKELEASL